MKQRLHGANSDKGAEFVHLRNSTFNHFLVVHAEKHGVELHPLVDGSVAVNNPPSADGFVVVCHENKAVFSVKFTFKSVHGEPIDVLIERLSLSHVFRRDTYGVFLGYDLVHFITSLPPREAR